GDSGQGEADRVDGATASRGTDDVDADRSDECAEEGEPDIARDRGDPEEGDPDRHGEGRPRVDAEDARIGQGIARESLDEPSRQAQSHPDENTEDGARQAEFEDDELVVAAAGSEECA